MLDIAMILLLELSRSSRFATISPPRAPQTSSQWLRSPLS